MDKQKNARNTLIGTLAVIACCCLVAVAMVVANAIPKTAEQYVKEYGGSLQVYQQILTSTDCADLQETFDRAAANNTRAEPGSDAHKYTLGYMHASDERMRAIGCYDN